jgi:hypothetical protein
MVSAALASAAVAIQDESLQVADVYLQKAISLYALVGACVLWQLLDGAPSNTLSAPAFRVQG